MLRRTLPALLMIFVMVLVLESPYSAARLTQASSNCAKEPKEICQSGQRVVNTLKQAEKNGKMEPEWCWTITNTSILTKCEVILQVEKQSDTTCTTTYPCRLFSPDNDPKDPKSYACFCEVPSGYGAKTSRSDDRRLSQLASVLLASATRVAKAPLVTSSCSKCDKIRNQKPPTQGTAPAPRPGTDPQPPVPPPVPQQPPKLPPGQQLPPVVNPPAHPPPATTPPIPPPPPPAQGPSVGDQIGNIGNGPTGNYGNYNRPAQNYAPSGVLSSFFGLGGTSYNSGSSGGSVAYAPGTYGPPPVTNANYESLDSQNTFAPPIQTPYGSIAQLGKNPKLTAEERAVLALVEKYSRQGNGTWSKSKLDTDILRNSLADSTSNFVENVQDVISGVSDFFLSMFVPPGDKKLSEEEKAADEARKALRFFLEPQDNLLGAGDPEALPTEIPDDEFQVPQGKDRGRGASPRYTGFSSGDAAADSTSDAIGTIANAGGGTTGGGASAGSGAAPGGSSEKAQAPGGGGNIDQGASGEPQGVVAKVKKTVTSMVSGIGSAIKSGFMRILSWFFW